MDFQIDENPENLIIPLELSKTIYSSYNADLVILDKPDQVYGKALHGNGSVNFKNGNIYVGELHNGMMHGQGKFTWKNGVVYQGEFKYNAIEGKGNYLWTDGSFYEGEVKASLRDGKGSFTAPNGEAKYSGQWKDGLRHGIGKIEFQGGAVYEGDFFQGYKHGQGKMTYPSGNFYEGNWKYDKKEGYGTMNWVNSKEKYYGNWKDNLQNGFGVHIWLENKGEGKLLRNRYEGQWKDGQRHGYGSFYYANGSKYEGEWKNNLKEGYAIFTEDNGNISQGIFKGDRLIKEKSLNKEKSPKGNIDIQKNNDKQKTNAQSQIQKQKTNLKDEVSPTNASQAALLKKKEIEVNPFTYLIDFSDLTLNIDDDVSRIQRDIQNMLLRHNSSLKQWYKVYSQKYENNLGEDAFSMDLQTYWKFVQDARILDSSLTVSSINRIFHEGAKNRFIIKQNEGDLDKQIELIKKIGRPLTLDELKDVDYLNLALQSSSEQPIDWNNIQESQNNNNNNNNQTQSTKQFDIHDSKRVVLYRHFIELIVRTSVLKYGNIKEMHRSFEKLVESKLIPMFEKQDKEKRPKSSLSEKSTLAEKINWEQNHQSTFQQIYNRIATNNKIAVFGTVDKTLKFKDFIKYLEKQGYYQSNDRVLLFNLLEKYYDTDQTLGHIDQLQKEEQQKEKKKAPKKGQDSKNKIAVVVIDYEKLKSEKLTSMVETELIYEEFAEILIHYLFKKEKDLQSHKENEVLDRFAQHLNRLNNVSSEQTIVKKPQRQWPTSQKDKQKKDLASLRIKQKDEADEKKRKQEERQRENAERARMQLNDYNAPSDQEDGEEDDY